MKRQVYTLNRGKGNLNDVVNTDLYRLVDETFEASDLSFALSAKEDKSNKGINNGYAPLDSGGKIPLANLPSTLLKYVGVWNASTNTPTLTNPDLTKIGNVYNVSVAGTQFGINFKLGDWLIYNASGIPEKSDNSDDVVSVNGQTGVVSLNADNIAESATRKWVSPTEKTTWNAKANDIDVVHKTGAETVAGVKTFSSSPLIPNATLPGQAAAFGQIPLVIQTITDNSTAAISSEAVFEALSDINELGGNLVYNGFGLSFDNRNFPTTTFDGTDTAIGGGSFKGLLNGSFQTHLSEKVIAIKPVDTYKFSVFAKQKGSSVTANLYTGLVPYDADGLIIRPQDYMIQANTTTTLATTLVNGATTIELTSAANWNNSGASHLRGIIFWNYVGQNGRVYAPGEYSRNNYFDLYNIGGISGNTITLKVPWAGGTIPAGTELSNSNSGGAYIYIGAANSIPNTNWTEYSGTVGGVLPLFSTTDASTRFPRVTSYVKCVVLMNIVASANSQIAFSGILLEKLITAKRRKDVTYFASGDIAQNTVLVGNFVCLLTKAYKLVEISVLFGEQSMNTNKTIPFEIETIDTDNAAPSATLQYTANVSAVVGAIQNKMYTFTPNITLPTNKLLTVSTGAFTASTQILKNCLVTITLEEI